GDGRGQSRRDGGADGRRLHQHDHRPCHRDRRLWAGRAAPGLGQRLDPRAALSGGSGRGGAGGPLMGRFIKLAAPDEPPEEDPLSGVANLFDASIVFIVGLMITLFSVYNMGDLMSGEGSVTMVKTDASGM